MFTSSAVFIELLAVYIFFVIFFWVLYYLSKWYYSDFIKLIFGPESPYFKLNDRNLREYHSRNVADIHCFIAAPLSTLSIFYCCDDSTKDIFSSQECLMKP